MTTAHHSDAGMLPKCSGCRSASSQCAIVAAEKRTMTKSAAAADSAERSLWNTRTISLTPCACVASFNTHSSTKTEADSAPSRAPP